MPNTNGSIQTAKIVEGLPDLAFAMFTVLGCRYTEGPLDVSELIYELGCRGFCQQPNGTKNYNTHLTRQLVAKGLAERCDASMETRSNNAYMLTHYGFEAFMMHAPHRIDRMLAEATALASIFDRQFAD